MSGKRLLVLASTSPRRRELLGIAGFTFSTLKVTVDETPLADEAPRDYTQRVSLLKAQAALPLVKGDPIVLAADTTVVDGEKIMGKPMHFREAEGMLRQLRGRTHQVYTAITVIDVDTSSIAQDVSVTDVPMRNYSDEEIAKYVASGDPFDKAGSYAIQNQDFRPVLTRTGCYANVIGLPLCHLLRTLRRINIDTHQDIPYLCQTGLNYECGVFTNVLKL